MKLSGPQLSRLSAIRFYCYNKTFKMDIIFLFHDGNLIEIPLKDKKEPYISVKSKLK